MTFDEYQKQARAFAIYPKKSKGIYPALLLAEEAGETVGKVAKWMRGGLNLDVNGLRKEIGDVLWALANLAEDIGVLLDDIAQENLEKLKDRRARGVIVGTGDNR